MSAPPSNSSLTVPQAILVGSLIVGAGLYFGLRGRAPSQEDRDPPEPSAPQAAGVRAVVSPADPGAPSSPARPPSLESPPVGLPNIPAELRSTVEKEASAALEAQRKEIVKQCWEPSFKVNPNPPKAKYSYNVTFDATGKQLTQGISEDREALRGDVGQCLRARPMSLEIPPPGVNVDVDIPFILP